jgi:hypothetical protein
MENKSIGIIISAVVAILLGAIFVGIIAHEGSNVTTKTSYAQVLSIPRNNTANGVNSSVKFHLTHGCAMNASDWRSDAGCNLEVVSLINVSGYSYNSGNFTFNTANADCGTNVSGDLIFLNSSQLVAQESNLTLITYLACPDTYVSQSWGRTIMNMVPGFFALAILAGIVYLIFVIARSEGIDLDAGK